MDDIYTWMSFVGAVPEEIAVPSRTYVGATYTAGPASSPPLCDDGINSSLRCVLQDSGKWPDEVEAIRKLSAALYLCMANCLNRSGEDEEDPKHLRFTAKAFPDHLQVSQRV